MCCMWNIQNFLLNLTYLSVPEKEDLFEARILGGFKEFLFFSKVCVLSPLGNNNKGHKTNSHNELDFLLTLNKRFFLYGFKNKKSSCCCLTIFYNLTEKNIQMNNKWHYNAKIFVSSNGVSLKKIRVLETKNKINNGKVSQSLITSTSALTEASVNCCC